MSDDGLLRYLESVVYGGRRGVGATMVRGGLRGLSLVYRCAIGAYLLPYGLGLRRRLELPCPVVSVGNLVVGGTGKTPTVLGIARGLAERGFRPAVLSYGYGGSLHGDAAIVSDYNGVRLTPDVSGDEPVMLAESLPGIPVVVGKHRHVSGRMAVDELSANVLILDDGFQVWKLARTFDVVLVDARKPFDNGRTLPAGLLREPKSAIRRAHCVIVTGAASASDGAEAEAAIRRAGCRAPVFTARYRPRALTSLDGSAIAPLPEPSGRRLLAVSAIAHPESFARTVADAGIEVAGLEAFPDHHAYDAGDAGRICARARELSADGVVITDKDAVKLRRFSFDAPVHVLRAELAMDDEAGFWGLLTSAIGGGVR